MVGQHLWFNFFSICKELHVADLKLLCSSDAFSMMGIFSHMEQKIKGNESQLSNGLHSAIFCLSHVFVDEILNLDWLSHLLYWWGLVD